MSVTYEPIAIFCSSHSQTYEAPRQGVLAEKSRGHFKLNDNFNQDAVEDLLGFDRIWIIYDFHQNTTWKPKVRPPRFSEKKRSVFSTRSPYRPNSIGMSCVKLDKIEGQIIFISEHDILDGSPILDIKPYLPYADAFSEARTGWVKTQKEVEVIFSQRALKKIEWLEDLCKLSFKQILSNQLAYEPLNSKAKRVSKDGDVYIFAIRTWRFVFQMLSDTTAEIIDVKSGYTEADMNSTQDLYQDKNLHHLFCKKVFT